MNKLGINRHHLSQAYWNIVFDHSAFYNAGLRKSLEEINECIEEGRRVSDYNTGSISFSSALCIGATAAYFKPKIIAEVGTFIGRSAFSLTKGMEFSGAKVPTIYTCDYSNDIPLRFTPNDHIVRHPKTSSTAMFQKLLDHNIFPELYLIDGRLPQEDARLLQELGANNSIFILDDFVGTEKGVSNAVFLQNIFQNNFIMCYPASTITMQNHKCFDASVIAVLIPASHVQFTN